MIVQRKRLSSIVKKLKKSNKKIVFTNGCFDILHRGHIEYLKKAKKLGDILIIGLNSDISVRKIKGRLRPINKENDRAKVLDSLKYVDYVVTFNEKTPLNLIKKIKPDILVKGGDWKEKDVAGAGFVKKNNGIVKIIKFKKGYSTTGIINKILSINGK